MRVPPPRVVRDYVRHLGLRRSLLRSTYVAANKLFALSILDCMEIGPGEPNDELLGAAADYECRFLEAGEVDSLCRDLEPEGRRSASAAIGRGDQCFGVLDGGRLANIGFYASGPTPILGDLVVGFEPPARYMHGAFTAPEYRGRRLHGAGVVAALIALFERGVPRLVTVYERTNYRSMVSAQRMGWRNRGAMWRVGAGGRNIVRRDSEAAAARMELWVAGTS